MSKHIITNYFEKELTKEDRISEYDCIKPLNKCERKKKCKQNGYVSRCYVAHGCFLRILQGISRIHRLCILKAKEEFVI